MKLIVQTGTNIERSNKLFQGAYDVQEKNIDQFVGNNIDTEQYHGCHGFLNR